MKPPQIELAVLIAGGKSRRMQPLGDKALLDWHGRAFWQRQLETLGALGPTRLAVAAPSRPGWLPASVAWAQDFIVSDGPIGPMGGLLAALELGGNGLVAALAVDLPALTPEYLFQLRSLCGESTGAVPQSAAGYEPLAAIYPAAAAESGRNWIASGRHDLHGWIDQLISAGLMKPQPIQPAEAILFRNLNTPEDLVAERI